MDEKMILSMEDNSDAEIEVGTKHENGETVYFICDKRSFPAWRDLHQ